MFLRSILQTIAIGLSACLATASLAATCDYQPPTSVTVRPGKPVRLGGYFYTGKLDVNWYAANFDLLDLNAKNDPRLVADLKRLNPSMLVFQQFLANQVAIKQDGAQAAEGYDLQKMSSWLWRTTGGVPAHPRGPYYLMVELGSQSGWAEHFSDYVSKVLQATNADGIVLDEVPLRATGLFAGLSGYSTDESLQTVTRQFLAKVRSSIKRPVLINVGDLSTKAANGDVLWATVGREIDGAWHEGWVRFYGAHQSPHAGESWEWDIRSAEQFSAAGKPYIASAAFSDKVELEYALANYLLAVRGPSLVFQPMVAYNPTTRGGFNFELAQRAVVMNKDLFDIELGCALRQRERAGPVWIRKYENGLVIVNPTREAADYAAPPGEVLVDIAGRKVGASIRLGAFEGRILKNARAN